VLLALGPLFIALLFFETTKRFFESWIAQLANYAFVTILTVLVAALMLTLVSAATTQAANAEGGIDIAQAVRVCMAAGLTFLVMRQVMPMAAGLASGLAPSSFGVVSAALLWGFGTAARSTKALSGRRPDGGSRGPAGSNTLSRGAASGMGRIARRWRENSVRRVRT
jgi:type IV secretion system protein VirB6